MTPPAGLNCVRVHKTRETDRERERLRRRAIDRKDETEEDTQEEPGIGHRILPTDQILELQGAPILHESFRFEESDRQRALPSVCRGKPRLGGHREAA